MNRGTIGCRSRLPSIKTLALVTVRARQGCCWPPRARAETCRCTPPDGSIKDHPSLLGLDGRPQTRPGPGKLADGPQPADQNRPSTTSRLRQRQDHHPLLDKKDYRCRNVDEVLRDERGEPRRVLIGPLPPYHPLWNEAWLGRHSSAVPASKQC